MDILRVRIILNQNQINKKEEAYNLAVEKYHKKLEEESDTVQDVSIFTRGIKFIGYSVLGLTLFLAIKTLVASPDEATYI